MGSGRIEAGEQIDMEAIVTLGGKIPERMVIEEIEILPVTHHIELTDIAPDWMSGRDDADGHDDIR